MSHPLLCWDIVLEGRGRREEFEHDLRFLNKLEQAGYWKFLPGRSLDNALVWENKTILVTSANLEIVFASKNIVNMNGYLPKEVVGKTPKLFQGRATESASRKIISAAVQDQAAFTCSILNYRKDGSLYNCSIEGYPVVNEMGKLVNYVAIEEEIPC